MKVKKYEPMVYAILRAEQIKMMMKSISWREKRIKFLTKQNKRAKNSTISA